MPRKPMKKQPSYSTVKKAATKRYKSSASKGITAAMRASKKVTVP